MRGRRNRLAVFARLPQVGRGKRRLAAGIGAVAAWRFYRTALAALLRRLGRDPRWDLQLAVTPDAAAGRRGWPLGRGRVRFMAQGPGDLGERMGRCLRSLPAGPAIVIGSDIPGIDGPRIARAFRMLGRREMVFGPAEDGGYWLVGARRVRPLPAGLFAGVRWSTEHALADTLATLPRGCSVGFVDRLADIDDAEALRRWRRGGGSSHT